jgi:hypothetical protein
MEEQTRLGIPWRMLREKLVTLDPSTGKVEYQSTFQDHTDGRRSVRHQRSIVIRGALRLALSHGPILSPK